MYIYVHTHVYVCVRVCFPHQLHLGRWDAQAFETGAHPPNTCIALRVEGAHPSALPPPNCSEAAAEVGNNQAPGELLT